jgi:CMP-N,N'-diacetyllegionaminic acid synthase
MNKNRSKILAIIPARAGSKRLPGKNFKKLHGKPLIQWTIESAINSKYISDIVLTSNDETVLNIGGSFESVTCIKRLDDLSDDHTSSSEVALDVLASFSGFDYFIFLQPTSPLRKTHHIDQALESVLEKNVRSCVSLCKSKESPYLMYQLGKKGNINPIIRDENITSLRSQDLPASYILNGAIYINTVSDFISTKEFVHHDSIPFIMDRNSSIDIDTIEDFTLAEEMLSKSV